MPDLPSAALRRAVRVWLLKPQAAHRRLFGSKVTAGDVSALCACPDAPATLQRLLVPRSPHQAAVEEAVQWTGACWRFRAVCRRRGHVAEYEVAPGARPGEGEAVEVRVLRVDVAEAPPDDPEWLFSAAWLQTDLMDRLCHWHDQQPQVEPGSGAVSDVNVPMRLVDVERYVAVHRRLKERHARALIASWPERTDPEKFVHEDLSIAAYLLCLWSADDPNSGGGDDDGVGRPVRFVDLGCGNGLLVFLLNSEGHAGLGLDVRRRRIWDQYPEPVRRSLREVSLDPSEPGAAERLFPQGTAWLLGNHSDELTPWIPVLAARTSAECNYWVLPCCPHDLFAKFSAPSSSGAGNSRYAAYLRYVGDLGRRCGFEPQRDLLRIPSTRRTAWVGRAGPAAGDPEARRRQLAAVAALVDTARPGAGPGSNPGAGEGGRQGQSEFRPRPAVEPVRNCTRLPVSLRETACAQVFSELLRRGRPEEPRGPEDRADSEEAPGRWNAGGEMLLAEVGPLLGKEALAAMKAQHGGVQTLLRNHHQAFEVAGGRVRIRREPRRGWKEAEAAGCLKKSACWMANNHPDGCPRPADQCPFRHPGEEVQGK